MTSSMLAIAWLLWRWALSDTDRIRCTVLLPTAVFYAALPVSGQTASKASIRVKTVPQQC